MRQLPSPSISSGLRLTAMCEDHAVLGKSEGLNEGVLVRGAPLPQQEGAGRSVHGVGQDEAKTAPAAAPRNPGASACTNRERRSPKTRDTSDSGTGRKRENQAPKGRDRPAAVIHQTACNSPCLQRGNAEVFADEGQEQAEGVGDQDNAALLGAKQQDYGPAAPAASAPTFHSPAKGAKSV